MRTGSSQPAEALERGAVKRAERDLRLAQEFFVLEEKVWDTAQRAKHT